VESKPATNNKTVCTGAPDWDSRSVEREGANAAARNIVKWGAHAAAPAPQASLTVSRQPPSLRVAAKCGVCVVALLGFVVLATTFVARLASIRILPATQSAWDLIRGSLRLLFFFLLFRNAVAFCGPLSQINQLAALRAKRAEAVRLIPRDAFSASRAVDGVRLLRSFHCRLQKVSSNSTSDSLARGRCIPSCVVKRMFSA